MYNKLTLALTWLALTAHPGDAQEWAKKMFEKTTHDFGSVARAAKAEYEFVVTNLYVEDVHIASVRTSCGCTTPSIKNADLKTHQKGAILAHFNTDRFVGYKGATLTVTIDKPFYAEVQLRVSGNIRNDVAMSSESVEMGTVEQGTLVEKAIALAYAGRNDWQILDVKSSNPHITAKAKEVSRSGGQVSYHLFVKMDQNAPVGYVREHLMLVTNETHASQIPIAVEGVVQAGIVVSPASLFMGVVHPGQKVTKQLVVKGNKPFRIVSVDCDDKGFQFDTSSVKTPKSLHLIPVTFVAGNDPGKVSETIRIETDANETAPVLSAYAVVAGK
jgi:hypothetical protein